MNKANVYKDSYCIKSSSRVGNKVEVSQAYSFQLQHYINKIMEKGKEEWEGKEKKGNRENKTKVKKVLGLQIGKNSFYILLRQGTSI